MRIATWNVNSLKARLHRVEEWLAYAKPDVLCMQETKLADEAFPYLAFEQLGYESAHNGEGRWNGVAIASRVGLADVTNHMHTPHVGDPGESRIVTATCDGVKVSSVYVPNGRDMENDHYQYKLRWMDDLLAHVDTLGTPGDEICVCGDFNIAPNDTDVHPRIKAPTHTSNEIRAKLANLKTWGMEDVFNTFYPDGAVYSWWDYRAGDFHQGRGLRIDLVMASTALASTATWGIIDRNARKGKQPSDHAPVVVEFAR